MSSWRDRESALAKTWFAGLSQRWQTAEPGGVEMMLSDRHFDVTFTVDPPVHVLGDEAIRRAEAVAHAWARRDLPLDWLERGLAAVPGVYDVHVSEREQ